MCARRLGYLALYIMSTSALGPIAVSPGNVPVEEYSLAAAKRAEWESKRRQSVEGSASPIVAIFRNFLLTFCRVLASPVPSSTCVHACDINTFEKQYGRQ